MQTAFSEYVRQNVALHKLCRAFGSMQKKIIHTISSWSIDTIEINHSHIHTHRSYRQQTYFCNLLIGMPQSQKKNMLSNSIELSAVTNKIDKNSSHFENVHFSFQFIRILCIRPMLNNCIWRYHLSA